MSRKIKHNQYEVVALFRNENSLAISAEFLPTGEHFANTSVELIRISKDTVLVALEKKSEKNIRCEFEQLVEEGKNSLLITFIVNFDYLPEFKEQVRLQLVEMKGKLATLNLANIHAQVQEISNCLDNIQKNGPTSHNELSTTYVNTTAKEVWKQNVGEGKYILRFSGMIINSASGINSSKLEFEIQTPGQAKTKRIVFTAHSQPSYYFPFSSSEILNCEQGDIKVSTTSIIPNANINNLHFVLNRVVDVN